MKKENGMSDGLVILGTVSIVGLVAIFVIALVYDRSLLFHRSSSAVEISATSSKDEQRSIDQGGDDDGANVDLATK